MNAEQLLAGYGIASFAGEGPDEGFRKFACTHADCSGAAKLLGSPDDAGQWWLYCRCTQENQTGGRSFTEPELARWLGANGHTGRRETGRAPRTAGFLDFPRNDAGNAAWFAGLYADKFRYVHQLKLWREWTGRRWEDDVTERAEQHMVEAMRDRYVGAVDIPDEKAATAEAKWAIGSQSAKRVRDALTLARGMVEFATEPGDYDRDPWLLNARNVAFDLRTGLPGEHDPAQLCSKLAPVSFDPAAECPRFDRFLDEVFAGDGELCEYLRRAFGYSTTGVTREHVLFLLWGSGCNGKSTLLRILSELLGDYARNADFASFGYAREKQAGVRDDLAALAGARMVTAAEPSVGLRFSEGVIKQITGGDEVTARHLYGRYFSYVPTFKLWFSCNHRPTMRDTSEGFWRRVHLIPLTVSFRGREDPGLLDELRAGLPGILNWALLGAQEWQDMGLDPPGAVQAATSDYRASEDAIGAFLLAHTEEAQEAVLFSRLYGAYEAWCQVNRETPVSSKAFSQALVERGYRQEGSSVRTFRGLRLHTVGDDDGT